MQKRGSINQIEKLPFENKTKERISILVDRLSQFPEIHRIVLFGSYARMEQKLGSDLDILALTTGELPRELRGGLHSEFEEQSADLVFYSEEQFAASECTLVKNIRRDGVLLWEA